MNIKTDLQERCWLNYAHNGTERIFAFPPFMGAHKECYQRIKNDNEIIPADEFDLAMLTEGAYTQKTLIWQRIRRTCFANGFTRFPLRTIWIPHKSDLAGILLEEDLEGLEKTKKGVIPNSISDWKRRENGVYESPDKIRRFVPEGSYNFGEHTPESFAKDGFATALLSAEGAEMFSRVAFNAGLKPWIWGLNIKDIKEVNQSVALLIGDKSKLSLEGDGSCYSGNFYAFGVRKIEEAKA